MRQERVQHRIVVLGAGYTGMMAALQAARRTRRLRGRVTLVNPSSRFVERLRMHQLASGQPLRQVEIPALLAGTGIEFVPGRATGLDPDARLVQVRTPGGSTDIGYDTLVYAIGSRADTGRVPGADLHAHTLDDPASAARLAARLAALSRSTDPDQPRRTVLVCGAGLTGVEAATELAESHPGLRVVLVSRQVPAPMMGDRARAHLLRALARLGIEVRAGVQISKVLPDGVELAGGELIAADACLWTTGFVAAPLARAAGLLVDDAGRIVVDPALRSVSHPDVLAIGDAAAVRQPFGVLHGTCQSGIPMAAHAAAAVGRALAGKPARPFRFGYVHQPVSLGRRDAVIQFTRPDDTPTRWYLAGRVAVRYKELVTSSPVPTFRLARHARVPAALLRRPGQPR
jgi:NADH dehydrogenase FAD-containing subunit